MSQNDKVYKFKVTYPKAGKVSQDMRDLTMGAHDVYSRPEDSDTFPTFKEWWENLYSVTESVNRVEFLVTLNRSPVIGVVAQVVPDIHYGKVVSVLWSYAAPGHRKPSDLRYIRDFLVNLCTHEGARAYCRTSRTGPGEFKLKYKEV